MYVCVCVCVTATCTLVCQVMGTNHSSLQLFSKNLVLRDFLSCGISFLFQAEDGDKGNLGVVIYSMLGDNEL